MATNKAATNNKAVSNEAARHNKLREAKRPRAYRIGERVVLNYGMRGEIRERLGEGRYSILRADRVVATYADGQFRKAEPN